MLTRNFNNLKTTKERKDEFVAQGSEIETELLGIFDREADIVIADIGACEGLSTIIYSKIFPNAKFVCFEPIKSNYDLMTSNFEEYSIRHRIIAAVPAAVGDRDGKRVIWKSSGDAPGVTGWETGNKSSSLLRPKLHEREHRWCRFQQVEEVEVWKIDYLASILGFKIDFAHIDVQGAEMMVLKGGENAFKDVKAIWLEVANIELYANQPLKQHISKYLDSRGMRCIKDTCSNGKYGDMLWVR